MTSPKKKVENDEHSHEPTSRKSSTVFQKLCKTSLSTLFSLLYHHFHHLPVCTSTISLYKSFTRHAYHFLKKTSLSLSTADREDGHVSLTGSLRERFERRQSDQSVSLALAALVHSRSAGGEKTCTPPTPEVGRRRNSCDACGSTRTKRREPAARWAAVSR